MHIKRALSPLILGLALVTDLQIALIHNCNTVYMDFFNPQGALLSSGLRDLMIAYAMPIYPVLVNMASHLPASLDYLPILVVSVALSLVIFATGSYLRSALAGALAALGFALAELYDLQHGRLLLWDINDLETLLYALSCTCVAYMLVRRSSSRVRSLGMEVLTAASIGVSFMIRSPLCLLPPALALLDIVSGKLSRRETTWLNLCILCAVPFLFLLPWVFMNYSVWNMFILFEHGRLNSNVISGAMGVIWTVEGAAAIAGLDPSGSLAVWAVKTVLAHPLRYLAAVLARFYTIVSWYPAGAALAAVSAAYFRKDDKFKSLVFFAAYFISLHIMLSIEPRYFFPLWPVFLLLMAALVSPARRPQGSCRVEGVILAAFMSAFIMVYMFISWRLVAYARSARTEPIMGETMFTSGDPVALVRLSQLSSSAGYSEDALAYAKKALLLRPSSETYSEYFFALMCRGVDISVPLKRAERYFLYRSTDYMQLEAANLFLSGRASEGRLKLALAVNRRKLAFKKISSAEEVSLYHKQQEDILCTRSRDTLLELARHFSVETWSWLEKQILAETSIIPDPSPRELILGWYLNKAGQIADIDCSIRGQRITASPAFKELLDSTVSRLENPKLSFRGLLHPADLPQNGRERQLARLTHDGEVARSLELFSAFHNRNGEGATMFFMRQLLVALVKRDTHRARQEAAYIALRLSEYDLSELRAANEPPVLNFLRSMNIGAAIPAAGK